VPSLAPRLFFLANTTKITLKSVSSPYGANFASQTTITTMNNKISKNDNPGLCPICKKDMNGSFRLRDRDKDLICYDCFKKQVNEKIYN
jgi:hypothetical protein